MGQPLGVQSCSAPAVVDERAAEVVLVPSEAIGHGEQTPAGLEGAMAEATEFCCAAATGRLAAVRQMLARGVAVNAVDYDRRSALHLAAARGHFQVVEHLIEARADVQAADCHGRTPLDEAQRGGFRDVCAALVVAGAVKGATPPANAAQQVTRAARGSQASQDNSTTSGTSISDVPVRWMRQDSEELQDLVVSASLNAWAVNPKEIKLEGVMSRTLKSTIFSARWHGTKVVAKFPDPLIGAFDDPFGADSTPLLQESTPQEAAQEMLHEVHLLSTLRHPDLVMFLGACLEHKPPFFLTEYMEGGDLDMFYRTKSKPGCPYRPPWATFVKWLSSVARALCYLHNCSRPIIHRDLKPMNLLLNSAQDLKVADFGISKLMTPKAAGDGTDTNAAPRMSGGVGTWRYMAPEVVRYLPYTDRVDIFSFALIMWFMYTGLDPFVKQFGEDAALVLEEYVAGREPRPDALESGAKCGPALPKDLHELLQDCWHEIPERRPSAEECTERLASLLATEAPGGRFALVNRSSCLGGKARAVV